MNAAILLIIIAGFSLFLEARGAALFFLIGAALFAVLEIIAESREP